MRISILVAAAALGYIANAGGSDFDSSKDYSSELKFDEVEKFLSTVNDATEEVM